MAALMLAHLLLCQPYTLCSCLPLYPLLLSASTPSALVCLHTLCSVFPCTLFVFLYTPMLCLSLHPKEKGVAKPRNHLKVTLYPLLYLPLHPLPTALSFPTPHTHCKETRLHINTQQTINISSAPHFINTHYTNTDCTNAYFNTQYTQYTYPHNLLLHHRLRGNSVRSSL